MMSPQTMPHVMPPTDLPPKTVPSGATATRTNPLLVYLIVARGSKKGTPILIPADLFLIGSDSICQLRNPRLGPKHCALVTRDKKVFVRDLHGGQSTVVNGEAIPPGEEWPVHAGDLLSVGNL